LIGIFSLAENTPLRCWRGSEQNARPGYGRVPEAITTPWPVTQFNLPLKTETDEPRRLKISLHWRCEEGEHEVGEIDVPVHELYNAPRLGMSAESVIRA